MHVVLEDVQASVQIPVLSLLDAVADAVEARGMRTVGLLGTRFTMERTFYHETLARRGIAVLVPDAEDRAYVNDVIYGQLAAHGAEGVILGCTEIPLLVGEADAGMPLFDSTILHAEAALHYAVANAEESTQN